MNVQLRLRHRQKRTLFKKNLVSHQCLPYCEPHLDYRYAQTHLRRSSVRDPPCTMSDASISHEDEVTTNRRFSGSRAKSRHYCRLGTAQSVDFVTQTTVNSRRNPQECGRTGQQREHPQRPPRTTIQES